MSTSSPRRWPTVPARALHAAAAALGQAALRRASATALAGLPSGWRNNPAVPQVARYDPLGATKGEPVEVGYRVTRDGVTAHVDGEAVALRLLGTEVAAPAGPGAGRSRCGWSSPPRTAGRSPCRPAS